MPLGDNEVQYGATRSSNIENREHQISLYAKRVTEIPSDMQMRIEYSGDLAIYVGYAPRGLSASATGWLIQKLDYTGSNVTYRSTAFDSWNNRATATYA